MTTTETRGSSGRMLPDVGSNMARASLLVLLCVVAMPWMGEATASSSQCYAVKDADRRAYCLAEAKRDYGYCYRVKDVDQRKLCLARLKGAQMR